jgi:serine/threonine protein kinase
MSDEEARLIWQIYASALKRPPDRRGEYLDRVCGENRSLRSRLDALLESPSFEVAETQTGMHVSPGSPPAGGAEDDLTGRQIGSYSILRKLGRGGMGVVYLAHDTRLARDVAIKAINRDHSHSPEIRERLRNEARIAGGLSHPGIATIYALEEIDGELYLACEYVPGAPLRALVSSGPLPIVEVVDIGLQLANALAEAHTKGIVHRDIKPENIIKTPSGVIKVLDFGLARIEHTLQPQLTQTGMLVGTPAYLSPEQAAGQRADFRTDIFALGLLMYELASGTNPFAAGTLEATFARILQAEPPPLSSVQPNSIPDLDRIVARCLRKDPLARYRSTREIISDLEQLRADLTASRSPASPDRVAMDRTGRARSRRWLVNHHVIVSVVYIVLLYPAWYARGWLPAPWNMWFLLCVLAAAAAATSMRLHLWFTALTFPLDLERQQKSTQLWMRVCDVVFAGTQLAAGLSVADGHPEFSMLFVTAAVAILIAAFVIEPATVRAAFRER